MTKICSTCDTEKPLSMFYIRKDLKGGDGYSGKCKACTIKTATDWWHRKGKKIIQPKPFVPRKIKGAECEACCQGGHKLREMKLVSRTALVCSECEQRFGWQYNKVAM